jgi:hypothetical protein
MTRTRELEAEIKRVGIKKKDLAKELNISVMGLYRKIMNKSEFKASEIAKLSKILGLPNERRDYIFFAA